MTGTQASERWERRGDAYRCRVHGVEFARGEVCIECVDDPGDAPASDPGAASAHDKELARREGELRTLVKKLRRKASALLDGGVAKDLHVVAKLLAEATKMERLAWENRERRAQREHERLAIVHEREMSGIVRRGGRSH